MRPITVPMPTLIITTKNAILREILEPSIILLKISQPILSVPKICFEDGGINLYESSILVGS